MTTMDSSHEEFTVARAERVLLWVWVIGSLPSAGLVIAQTISGHFRSSPFAGPVWLLEVIALILVYLAIRGATRRCDLLCRRNVFKLCLFLSTAILIAIPISRFCESLFEFGSVKYLAISQLALMPCEVLLLLLLSYLPQSSGFPAFFNFDPANGKLSVMPGTKGSDPADHLENAGNGFERKDSEVARIGTKVFIGHGGAAAWRELKDFVHDRLRLPWDEFNRVPVAGVSNSARLSEMLDEAAIALLVLTGEDERADGGIQARMNVTHEVGLFQGRLGFPRALVLLEEGCAEFSNIQGLGQIRFPKGRISAVFEDVRRVLEREGLLSPKP